MILLHHLNTVHLLHLPRVNHQFSSNNKINGLITNTRPKFTFRSPSTPEQSSVTTHALQQKILLLQIYQSPLTLICYIQFFLTRSRPTIPTIPTNPFQYNLSSTNIHTTQHSVYLIVHKTEAVTSNTTVQNNNVAVPSGSSNGTNPFVTPITQTPINTNNLQTSRTNQTI